MSSLLGKRYYESTQAGSNGTADANDDDEEDDYLSDKFLAEIAQSEAQS